MNPTTNMPTLRRFRVYLWSADHQEWQRQEEEIRASSLHHAQHEAKRRYPRRLTRTSLVSTLSRGAV
jgi:hypothetical protein